MVNDKCILANEINCRLYFFAAVYAVTLNSCLRQLLSVTSISDICLRIPAIGRVPQTDFRRNACLKVYMLSRTCKNPKRKIKKLLTKGKESAILTA